MRILIDGKEATIKKGSSFEYAVENRSFSDADGYSLSISFPLSGCPGNLSIFGLLNRKDLDAFNRTFDCEIIDIFFYKSGTLTITDVSEIEVKGQFLEGRSAQNYDDSFDDFYINEMALINVPHPEASGLDPAELWAASRYNIGYVALPWYPSNSESGLIQNDVNYGFGRYSWGADVERISFFPYLIFITKRICEEVGYKYDFTEWESRDDYKYILVCNALPEAWDVSEMARALPHWTVAEFFKKLELFLYGEFDIDHKNQKITFHFTRTNETNAGTVVLDKVVDSFSSEVSDEDESKYDGIASVRYKSAEHEMQKFYDCDWFIKQNKDSIVEYETLDDLIAVNKQYAKCRTYPKGGAANKILYAKDYDTYFVIRCVRTKYVLTNSLGVDIYDRYCILQPINTFGPFIPFEDAATEIELEFVPAWIDETEPEKGDCLFIDCGTFNGTVTEEDFDGQLTNEERASVLPQPFAMQWLDSGESSEKAEYFNVINVGYWDGAIPEPGGMPRPTLDWLTVTADWSTITTHFSLRLKSRQMSSPRHMIDPRRKYEFSFVMNGIPNVRAVFQIGGKKYLCSKITTTFSEKGLSELKKGTFFRIED